MRLVICDDHGLLLEAMALALADHGQEVVALARDPEAAIEAVARHQPDLVLLDLNFPDGPSLPAIGRIRQASPATRVVMLSGDGGHSMVAQAIAAGASGYVGKERLIHEVLEALELAVQGHLAVEPAVLRLALQPHPPSSDPLWPLTFLTDREWEILRCIVEGKSTDDIAGKLSIRRSTARTHVQNVLTKLGVHSRLQAAALVAAHGSDDIWPAHVR
jgi:two-component system nitrate/nitrite response regulator NarL